MFSRFSSRGKRNVQAEGQSSRLTSDETPRSQALVSSDSEAEAHVSKVNTPPGGSEASPLPPGFSRVNVKERTSSYTALLSGEAAFGLGILADECPKATDLLPDMLEVGQEIAGKIRASQCSEDVPMGPDLNEHQYHMVVRERLHALTHIFLQINGGKNAKQKLGVVLKGYWCKTDLLKTLEAVEAFSQSLNRVKGIHELIRTEYHHPEDQYRLWMEDCPDSAACSTKVKLMHTLIFMMLIALPIWKTAMTSYALDKLEAAAAVAAVLEEPPDEDFVNRAQAPNYGSTPAVQYDDLGLAIRMGGQLPPPTQDRQAASPSDGERAVKLRDQLMYQEKVQDTQSLGIDPRWLPTDTALVDLGREYALLIGLRKLHESAAETPEAKRMLVLEEIVLSYMRGLVSGLVGALKSQADAAQAARTKIYGFAFTVAIGFFNLFARRAAEHKFAEMMQATEIIFSPPANMTGQTL